MRHGCIKNVAFKEIFYLFYLHKEKKIVCKAIRSTELPSYFIIWYMDTETEKRN